MENLENNKLIAEFMGYEAYEYRGHTMFIFDEDNHRTELDLHYHTSWDWLMPVVEEIDHLQHEPVQSIEDALSTRCIEGTYRSVVEFIKLYNTQKQ